ncbi:MAG: helicase-exonuclease AddAB subunit AddA [Lachnospiraceae bacterium]|nr:helicase-exonuclease AddAB subunit AddA [Lachnospiraceae bacterium]
MAKIEYTPEQKTVIDSRDCQMLVSAAAGSGKTAVLTQRIISLISDKERPADIDRFLIVTFTKAAAAEMRERIGSAIAAYLAEHPGDRRMSRQAVLLNNAQISTIDSFCNFVVKNNFADIDLEPGFRTMEEGEGKLLLQDALDEILEEEYAAGSEGFINLVDSYVTGGNESTLEKMIKKLLNQVRSYPDPEAKLRASLEEESVLGEEWYGFLKKRSLLLIKEIYALVTEAEKLCREPDGPDKYLPTVEEYKLLTERLSAAEEHNERVRLLGAFSPKLTPVRTAKVDPELKERAQALINKAKDYVGKLRKYFSRDEESECAALEQAVNNIHELARLALRLLERFGEKKRERQVVDFNDMEHFALKILTREEDGRLVPSKAALEYRDYFEYIFIDEYQDSNYLQEYVLSAIARENNRFMVGDVKQSIYRFRQARPEIFMDKYDSFSEEGSSRRIDLSSNFRSRKEVLDFVNDVFEVIMTRESCGIEYDMSARLKPEARYPGPEGDEYITEIETLVYDEEAEEVKDKTELEALMAARRISSLMREGFKVYDRDLDALRPVRYSDIVVLARSASSYDKAMTKVFAANDIPLYCGKGKGYLSAAEVRRVLDALRLIDNPRQDEALYGTLVHFLELMDDEDMVKLRKGDTGRPLIESIRSYPDSEGAEGETAAKCRKALEWLAEYRKYAGYMTVRELTVRLIEKSGYLDRASAMPGGVQRRANLKLLLERADEFEKSSYRGLFHFIRYIGQLKEIDADPGEADTISEDADVVRLMTIHKSKGLEFPVVICLGFRKEFNKSDLRDSLLLDPDLGMALYSVDTAGRQKYMNLKRRAMSDKMEYDLLAEEMRVLYVALTRAKEKLIITDIVSENDAEAGTPDRKAGIMDVLGCKGLMELIRCSMAGRSFSHCRERLLRLGELRDMMIATDAKGFADRGMLFDDSRPLDKELLDLIASEKERVYTHEGLRGLYTKTSVSELKRAAFEDEEAGYIFETERREAYVPDFVKTEEGSSGAARGSAYHRFLELTDFTKCPEKPDAAWIEETVAARLKSGRLSSEYAALIRPDAFIRFFSQELARRMSAAAVKGKLKKEQPFFMAVDARRVKPDAPEGESVVIQGVIDVFFEEEDGLVLLDYKTDRVSDAGELEKRYKLQLELYAEAMERILHKKVKERLIYSFALDKVIAL